MIHLEKKFGFSSSTEFIDFIEQEVLPNTGISVEKFWGGLARIVKELTPKNRELLETRSDMQSQIDEWHKANQNKEFDLSEYKKFLYSIGYMRGNQEENQTRFYIYFTIAISSSMGIAFAGNMFTLFIFYEILTLSTYPLVAHKQNSDARSGARIYLGLLIGCLLYTSPSPRDIRRSRMPSSA